MKGKPGWYEAVAYLRPHFQLETLDHVDAAGGRGAQEGRGRSSAFAPDAGLKTRSLQCEIVFFMSGLQRAKCIDTGRNGLAGNQTGR